jgi:hypothetical protein
LILSGSVLSEINRRKFKYANIGVAVATALALLSTILFQGSEELLGAMGLVSFAAGIAVFLVLSDREYRARTNKQRANPDPDR